MYSIYLYVITLWDGKIKKKKKKASHYFTIKEGKKKRKGKKNLTASIKVTVRNFTYLFSTWSP